MPAVLGAVLGMVSINSWINERQYLKHQVANGKDERFRMLQMLVHTSMRVNFANWWVGGHEKLVQSFMLIKGLHSFPSLMAKTDPHCAAGNLSFMGES